jgi:hypothetical protein
VDERDDVVVDAPGAQRAEVGAVAAPDVEHPPGGVDTGEVEHPADEVERRVLQPQRCWRVRRFESSAYCDGVDRHADATAPR